MRVLVACEESQVVTKEFRKLGHKAYSCDIKPCSGGHPEWHIKTSVLNIINDKWDLMIAHPECKRLSHSGVRWLHVPPKNKTFDDMWKELYNGVEFYIKLRDADINKKAIENPTMHKYAKGMIQPMNKQIVHPWWFGDKAFKPTGLELYNLPELVPTNKLIKPTIGTDQYKEWSIIHRTGPGPQRSTIRSRTFQGVAKAMAEQWGGWNI